MLAKIKEFVKKYQTDIILVVGVILISLLSFALGYIVAKMEEKEPIKIEKDATKYEFSYEYTKTDLGLINDFVYSYSFRIS